jgi:hypothetical protein
MARYLLVDDRDGRVLAELASAQQAVLLLGLLERNPQRTPKISMVRLDHQRGNLTDITSMVSVRPLPPLVTRRARIIRSRDRPSRPPPSTQPPRA